MAITTEVALSEDMYRLVSFCCISHIVKTEAITKRIDELVTNINAAIEAGVAPPKGETPSEIGTLEWVTRRLKGECTNDDVFREVAQISKEDAAAKSMQEEAKRAEAEAETKSAEVAKAGEGKAKPQAEPQEKSAEADDASKEKALAKANAKALSEAEAILAACDKTKAAEAKGWAEITDRKAAAVRSMQTLRAGLDQAGALDTDAATLAVLKKAQQQVQQLEREVKKNPDTPATLAARVSAEAARLEKLVSHVPTDDEIAAAFTKHVVATVTTAPVAKAELLRGFGKQWAQRYAALTDTANRKLWKTFSSTSDFVLEEAAGTMYAFTHAVAEERAEAARAHEELQRTTAPEQLLLWVAIDLVAGKKTKKLGKKADVFQKAAAKYSVLTEPVLKAAWKALVDGGCFGVSDGTATLKNETLPEAPPAPEEPEPEPVPEPQAAPKQAAKQAAKQPAVAEARASPTAPSPVDAAPVPLSAEALATAAMYRAEANPVAAALVVVACWPDLVPGLPGSRTNMIARMSGSQDLKHQCFADAAAARGALDRCVAAGYCTKHSKPNGQDTMTVTKHGTKELKEMRARWAAPKKQTPPSPPPVASPVSPVAPQTFADPYAAPRPVSTLLGTPLAGADPQALETAPPPAQEPAGRVDLFAHYGDDAAPVPGLALKKKQAPSAGSPTAPQPAIASSAADAFFAPAQEPSPTIAEDKVKAAMNAFFQ